MLAELLKRTKKAEASSSGDGSSGDSQQPMTFVGQVLETVEGLAAVGYGAYGRLAQGNLLDVPSFALCRSPSRLSDVSAVACGAAHVLILAGQEGEEEEQKGVYSWGKCHFGQLGHGFEDRDVWCPLRITNGPFSAIKVSQIAAGDSFSLALEQGGRSVWTWGCNYFGALGLGDEKSRYSPERVSLLDHLLLHDDHQGEGADETIRSVQTGGFHVLLVTSRERLIGWGRNDSGQLGLSDTLHRSSPVLIPIQAPGSEDQAAHQIVSVAGGFSHSVLLIRDSREVKILQFGHELVPKLKMILKKPPVSSDPSLSSKIQHVINLLSVPFYHMINDELEERDFVAVCCGKRSTTILSASGRVWTDEGGLPLQEQNNQDNASNAHQKVDARIALLEQLADEPSLDSVLPVLGGFQSVIFDGQENVKIDQIACGEYHCLALQRSSAEKPATLFGWGSQNHRKLPFSHHHSSSSSSSSSSGSQIMAHPLLINHLLSKGLSPTLAAGGSNHTFVLLSKHHQ